MVRGRREAEAAAGCACHTSPAISSPSPAPAPARAPLLSITPIASSARMRRRPGPPQPAGHCSTAAGTGRPSRPPPPLTVPPEKDAERRGMTTAHPSSCRRGGSSARTGPAASCAPALRPAPPPHGRGCAGGPGLRQPRPPRRSCARQRWQRRGEPGRFGRGVPAAPRAVRVRQGSLPAPFDKLASEGEGLQPSTTARVTRGVRSRRGPKLELIPGLATLEGHTSSLVSIWTARQWPQYLGV